MKSQLKIVSIIYSQLTNNISLLIRFEAIKIEQTENAICNLFGTKTLVCRAYLNSDVL